MRFPIRKVDQEFIEMIDVAFEVEAFNLVGWPCGKDNVIGVWIQEPVDDLVEYPTERRCDIPSNARLLKIRFECETPTPRDIWVDISLSESIPGSGYLSDYIKLGSKQITMGQDSVENRDFALRRYRIAQFLHRSLGAYETKACLSDDGEEEDPCYEFTSSSCPDVSEEDFPLD